MNTTLIAPTKRSNIAFLENACVEVSSGSLIYKKIGDGDFNDYNIPYANTNLILLGKSVQISQDGIRRLSDTGVMVCLCGFTSDPARPDQRHFQFLEPQLDRRSDTYMKMWSGIFLDDKRHSAAARRIIKEKVSFTKKMWELLPQASEFGVYPEEIAAPISALMRKANDSSTSRLDLYRSFVSYETSVRETIIQMYGFNSDTNFDSDFDVSKRYLDIANYFAYGYAAITLNALGIPFSFSVLSSSTGTSGLVFDLASVITDAICVPIALESAMSGRDEDEMISVLRVTMHEYGVLEHLFRTFKNLCETC